MAEIHEELVRRSERSLQALGIGICFVNRLRGGAAAPPGSRGRAAKPGSVASARTLGRAGGFDGGSGSDGCRPGRGRVLSRPLDAFGDWSPRGSRDHGSAVQVEFLTRVPSTIQACLYSRTGIRRQTRRYTGQVIPSPFPPFLPARIRSRLEVSERWDHWYWSGRFGEDPLRTSAANYKRAKVRFRGRSVDLIRVLAYTFDQPGTAMIRQCGNEWCVRPDHFEATPKLEQARRAIARGRRVPRTRGWGELKRERWLRSMMLRSG